MSMTENEAIEAIKNDLEWHGKELKPKYKECLRMAIKALEEVQAYRAIGTVAEVKALKEKNEPKKPIVKGLVAIDDRRYYCSKCNERLYREHFDVGYCNCGQSIRT